MKIKTHCPGIVFNGKAFAILLLIGSVFAAWHSAIGSANADPPARSAPATVPLDTTFAGDLLLHVQLTSQQGQRVDATFVLDTGAGSVISESLAKRLGLTPEPPTAVNGKPVLTPDGKPLLLATVPRLDVGTFVMPKVQCLVVGDRKIHGNDGTPEDGLLGSNVLSFYPTMIDYPRRLAAFFPHRLLSPADLKAVGLDGAAVIPVRPTIGGDIFTCPVRLQNGAKAVDEDLEVDIGTNITCLSEQIARRLGLTASQSVTADFLFQSLPLSASSLSSLSVGGRAGADGVLSVRDTDVVYSHGPLPAGIPAAIGMDSLSHGRVLLDFPDRKIYYQPSPPASLPMTLTPGGQPLVQLSFNGVTGTFLINTSVETSSLSADFLSRLRVAPRLLPDTLDKSGPTAASKPLQAATLRRVELGDA